MVYAAQKRKILFCSSIPFSHVCMCRAVCFVSVCACVCCQTMQIFGSQHSTVLGLASLCMHTHTCVTHNPTYRIERRSETSRYRHRDVRCCAAFRAQDSVSTQYYEYQMNTHAGHIFSIHVFFVFIFSLMFRWSLLARSDVTKIIRLKLATMTTTTTTTMQELGIGQRACGHGKI